MVNINAWLGQGNEAISATNRAVDAWNRIQRNPSVILLVRGKTATSLPAQSVRIEFDNTVSRDIDGEGAGKSSARGAKLFGVKDHPTVTDTDIARGDKFSLNEQKYRIVQIIAVPGEIQATAEVLA